jgi:hypothetical protein
MVCVWTVHDSLSAAPPTPYHSPLTDFERTDSLRLLLSACVARFRETATRVPSSDKSYVVFNPHIVIAPPINYHTGTEIKINYLMCPANNKKKLLLDHSSVLQITTKSLCLSLSVSSNFCTRLRAYISNKELCIFALCDHLHFR